MKTDKNIFIAFLLNTSFSIFELIGGMITNSVAIFSDAFHDFGDALSIGISLLLEKKSQKKPDKTYTYGYKRYSVIGAFITTTVLIVGSVLVIVGGISRIINPITINYNKMIIFAIFGVVINYIAAYFTKDGDSVNQKAVNLHMLEDVLGWLVILIGSIIMRFTDIVIIDSIMSIGVALFIFINAIRNFKDILNVFLEKTPNNISLEEIINHLNEIKDIIEVHHLHIWSMDGINNYATMHVVTNSKDIEELKKSIREEMHEHNISHITIEIESEKDYCDEKECVIKDIHPSHSHHHYHH
ncbi:MAG: cation diffusion facilitator family transporter [Bacilli bacterium]